MSRNPSVALPTARVIALPEGSAPQEFRELLVGLELPYCHGILGATLSSVQAPEGAEHVQIMAGNLAAAVGRACVGRGMDYNKSCHVVNLLCGEEWNLGQSVFVTIALSNLNM